ncbi:MAG: hypothetical protein LBH86_03375, partial [Oscillospiraceae bacterium]|nr:hypothetical protein [Oscillospiraceae bacterium]
YYSKSFRTCQGRAKQLGGLFRIDIFSFSKEPPIRATACRATGSGASGISLPEASYVLEIPNTAAQNIFCAICNDHAEQTHLTQIFLFQ